MIMASTCNEMIRTTRESGDISFQGDYLRSCAPMNISAHKRALLQGEGSLIMAEEARVKRREREDDEEER